MSLKNLSKTRWKIEPERVVIYPNGVFYIFTVVLAVLFSALLLMYLYTQNTTLAGSLPLVLFLLGFVLLFWGYATTFLEFDRHKGRMRKMFMGFLPVYSIPLSRLLTINIVSNTFGGYNYRLFKKNNKYGKGMAVSCGYSKSDDPNAIAFTAEAVKVIHGYLDQYDTPADYARDPITSYRYFTQENGVYTLKNKKIGAIIFGSLFILLAGFLTTVHTEGMPAKILMVAGVFFFGLIFINAAFTRLILDTNTQMIERKGPAKFFNRRYSFASFTNIQTIRRTVNFIYIGTDVIMYFDVNRKDGSEVMLTVSTFKKSANIERFIRELYQIMGIN